VINHLPGFQIMYILLQYEPGPAALSLELGVVFSGLGTDFRMYWSACANSIPHLHSLVSYSQIPASNPIPEYINLMLHLGLEQWQSLHAL